MYEKFYNLEEKPFQISPNPRYLYMSSNHDNALTYLEYGLMENVGFILLTGEVGTGKTTLVRHIMTQFESEKDIGVIFNTNISPDELLCLILHCFELKSNPSSKTKNIDTLYQFLIEEYARNRSVLLIIDEAQNLSDAALEEVRMLSNLQSDEQNLIQIMLVGQPELKVRLQGPGHNPFAQRIAVNFFLSALTDKETYSYIAYRLEKAGGKSDIFTQEAIDIIYRASEGIPRTINLICDAALVYGFGYEFETIDASVIQQVIRDKDSIGVNAGNEEKMGSFSFYDEPGAIKAYEDRLKKLEDTVVLMKGQMESLSEHVKLFQENLDGTLNDLLLKERKRNDQLLIAYSRLRVKYHYLMKLWKGKKGSSVSDDKDIILLK
jgi:general secretion pathway protein A